MKKVNTIMRVDKVQEIETHTKNTDKKVYRLTCRDADGVGSFIFTLPMDGVFSGFSPDSVVEVSVVSSQMSLDEFKGESDE